MSKRDPRHLAQLDLQQEGELIDFLLDCKATAEEGLDWIRRHVGDDAWRKTPLTHVRGFKVANVDRPLAEMRKARVAQAAHLIKEAQKVPDLYLASAIVAIEERAYVLAQDGTQPTEKVTQLIRALTDRERFKFEREKEAQRRKEHDAKMEMDGARLDQRKQELDLKRSSGLERALNELFAELKGNKEAMAKYKELRKLL